MNELDFTKDKKTSTWCTQMSCTLLYTLDIKTRLELMSPFIELQRTELYSAAVTQKHL